MPRPLPAPGSHSHTDALRIVRGAQLQDFPALPTSRTALGVCMCGVGQFACSHWLLQLCL